MTDGEKEIIRAIVKEFPKAKSVEVSLCCGTAKIRVETEGIYEVKKALNT